MSTWEERMAQRARVRRPNIPGRSVQQPIPPWQDPPDDGTCTECFEWRRYPPGQEHFGFAWWRTCHGCDHKHHEDEVWLAAPDATPPPARAGGGRWDRLCPIVIRL